MSATAEPGVVADGADRHDAWQPLAHPYVLWSAAAALGVVVVVGLAGSPPGRAALELAPAHEVASVGGDTGATTALKPSWWPGFEEAPYFAPPPAPEVGRLPRVTTPSRVLFDPASPGTHTVVTVVERYRDAETGEVRSSDAVHVGDRIDIVYDVRNLEGETLRDVRLDDPVFGRVEMPSPIEPFRSGRTTLEAVTVPLSVETDRLPRLALGTDPTGQDVAAGLFIGSWRLVVVAGGAALLALFLGGAAGLLAARTGRGVVTALGRAQVVLVTFPFLLVALVVVMLTGRGAPVLVLLIGGVAIPVVGRRVRDAAVVMERSGRVEIALASGRDRREVQRELVLPVLVRVATGTALGVAAAGALIETSLSFIGLRPPLPATSLGAQVADAVPTLDTNPGYVLLPGVLMILAVGGCVVLSEALARADEPETSG